jgi:hypothetical protein
MMPHLVAKMFFPFINVLLLSEFNTFLCCKRARQLAGMVNMLLPAERAGFVELIALNHFVTRSEVMPIPKTYFCPGVFGWVVADAKATDGPRTIR